MLSPESSERLRKVAEYAREHIHRSAERAGERKDLNYAGPDYRWEHTQRVTQYGQQIAEAERANVEVVVAACLLHDSEWYEMDDHRSHGRVAAEAIRPFLDETGYSPEDVDNICYSVAVHVDGNAGYEHEYTLEAKCVSDADNVDRFGAYRIVLTCLDDMPDYEKLTAYLKQRVQKLENYRQKGVMETAAGNRLFNEKLDFQIEFFRKMIAEHELTHLPEMETGG